MLLDSLYPQAVEFEMNLTVMSVNNFARDQTKFEPYELTAYITTVNSCKGAVFPYSTSVRKNKSRHQTETSTLPKS